jgi:hypothetical protein
MGERLTDEVGGGDGLGGEKNLVGGVENGSPVVAFYL